MGLVDLTQLSWDLLLLGVVFLMGIGSFFSLGILRLFQQRIRQGIILLILAVVSIIIFTVILNTKYL